MNTGKALVAGVVGGIVLAVWSFIAHGLIMGSTYAARPEVFRQDSPMFWFPIIAILLGIVGGLFFAKSRGSWAEGAKGGLTFGLWVGLIGAVAGFYNPLVFDGFPYFLSWCWAGINVIGWLAAGAVFGVMYKTS